MQEKDFKKKVREFLRDKSIHKIEVEIPSDFSIYSFCNPVGVWFRKVIIAILSKVPPMHLKTTIFKMMGYDFGRDVCLPGYIDIDPYFPRLIKLEKGVLVGGLSKISPWKIENGKLSIGRIHISNRVLLAGWSTIGPGAWIGENVITGINCIVDSKIPKNSFVIKNNEVIKTWNKKEIERHFGKSKLKRDYARNVRKLTKEFRKDEELRHIRFRNHGKRLNAGCDWWRARPIWQIYWNGILVESSVICPSNWGRKFLYSLMGVKFGKKFQIGKNVYFDHICGDFVKLGDNVIIEDYCFMDAHEYTISETVYAKTIVGNNVKIGEGSWVRGGVTIGDNAIILPNSDVMKDIGEGETWEGSPAKLVKNG